MQNTLPVPTAEELSAQAVVIHPGHWLAQLPSRVLWPLEAGDGPVALTRGQVRRYALGHDLTDPAALAGLFVMVAAWDSGPSPRLVARRVRALGDPEATGHRLRSALAVLAERGPMEAYEALSRGGRCFLPRVGPGLFTKLLYFAAPADYPHVRPLILDRLVANGLTALTGRPWPRGGWPAARYMTYLAQAEALGSALGVPTDAVEYALGRLGCCPTFDAREPLVWRP